MTIEDIINIAPERVKSKYENIDVCGNKQLETYNIYFYFNSILDPDDAIEFYHSAADLIEQNLKAKFNIFIKYTCEIDFSKYDMVLYYEKILNDLSKEKSRLLVLKDLKVEFTDHYIVNAPKGMVNFSLYTRELVKRFLAFGLEVDIEVIETEIVKPVIDIAENVEDNTNDKKVFVKNQKNIKLYQVEPISNIPSDQLGLSDHEYTKGPLVFKVRGEIFAVPDPNPKKIESKKFQNGAAYLFTFKICDGTDSIAVTRFCFKEDEVELLKKLKIGSWIEVKGKAEFSSFDRDVVLKAETIEEVEKPVKASRMDDAIEKRVELHLHSKMSTMDAVGEISDYVKTASKWGHRAISITDHEGVYGFPQMLHAIEDNKLSIKPIYGVEVNLVNKDDFSITFNSRDIDLREATYTVFDIETTGLSNQYDEVIEIGAYKYRNGQRIDSFEEFIKIEGSLPAKITKLTSITDEVLQKNGKEPDYIFNEFRKFIDGTILVAHNATFDVYQIYENFKKRNIPYEEFPVIDTLPLFKSLHMNDVKLFGLATMTKFFKVKLENHHRATDDAYATLEAFKCMLDEAYKLGVTNYKDLNKLIPDDSWKVMFGNHAIILAQTQAGYKNLSKILSDSLTVHMHQKGRVMTDVVDSLREGILIGSGCVNGEIFDLALNKCYDDLLKKIDYYDYIEVQPPSVYGHIALDSYRDGDWKVQEVIKTIIKAAKEKGKIVVATGDVHYLNPEDQKYRDIYLRTKGIGGGLHPLKDYPGVTKQHFRTTKEMLDEFSFLREELAYEIVVTNTNKIADMIEDIHIFPGKELFSPADDEFKDTLGVASIVDYLKELVTNNANDLYKNENTGKLPQLVSDRLEKELNSIISHGFSPNYYMAHILVKKSLDDGYLVGSRGSVGSSFVATLMNITEVNPLSPHYRCPRCRFSEFKMSREDKEKYGLNDSNLFFQDILSKVDTGFDLPNATCPICGTPLKKDGHDIPFETFLGFKGDKVPDIDLNFSGEYQPKAHEFIREVMGYDNAFRAGTLATVADKTAFGFVKGYCEDNHIVMRKAEIERVANVIQGAKRSTGQHPGGIVVVPKRIEIYDITPIQYPADDTSNNFRTTHFEYHTFESNLLKLDILGHDDPTLIRYFMNYVALHQNEFPFNRAQDIPVDDPDVLKIFAGTDILGVTSTDIMSKVGSLAIPEFGTKFVMDMLVDTKPKTFAELVKISGLSHGTDVWLNNAKDLVQGIKPEYGTIPFSKIIGCRDDIMVDLMYMGLEPSMAFNIMEFVRKGKAHKDPAKWQEHIKYMREHNVPEWYIWSCGQIKYMFPKAHATAYIMMALRIAWFKVHKPLLFYAGFFSKRVDTFDVVTMCSSAEDIRNRIQNLAAGTIDEEENLSDSKADDHKLTLSIALEMVCRGYKFLMVDINKSEATDFVMVEEENALLCPFSALQGLGEAVAVGIIEERKISPFKSKADVLKRTKINNTIYAYMNEHNCFGNLPDDIEENEFNLFNLDGEL